MGHLNHHRAYRDLQARIAELPVSLPRTPQTLAILKLLFSAEEAELVSRLPLVPRSLRHIARRWRLPEAAARKRLEQLADRGLIFDLENPQRGATYYCVAPPVVGFVEFSLMRVRQDLDQRRLAELYEDFFEGERAAGEALFGGQTQIGRTLVHEQALAPDDAAELLTYERASAVVQEAASCAVSLCYCRHKAEHLGKRCERPLENCLSLGNGADYVVRHQLGRPLQRAEALEILEASRQEGLVFIADNVQRRVTYLCSCCSCCCGQLQAINRWGLVGAIKTSNFIAEIDPGRCAGCTRCARRCPVQAIQISTCPPHERPRYPLRAQVDATICLGCGVCQPACKRGALRLVARPQRVLTPESTVERVLHMALERGKLQHLLFDDQQGISLLLLNRLVGAILNLPPVKRAMLQEQLRSRFVRFLLGRARRTKQLPEEL